MLGQKKSVQAKREQKRMQVSPSKAENKVDSIMLKRQRRRQLHLGNAFGGWGKTLGTQGDPK